MHYLGEPNTRLPTQKVMISFNHPSGEKLFEGTVYFHTPERIEEAMRKAGFAVTTRHEPLATKEYMRHHPQMWGDEDKIPYHLVVIGTKALKTAKNRR